MGTKGGKKNKKFKLSGLGRPREYVDPELLKILASKHFAKHFDSLGDWAEEAGVGETTAKEINKKPLQWLNQQQQEERWTKRIITALETTLDILTKQHVSGRTKKGSQAAVVGHRQCYKHMTRWKGKLKLGGLTLPNERQWKAMLEHPRLKHYSTEASRTRPDHPPRKSQANPLGDSRTPRGWRCSQ